MSAPRDRSSADSTGAGPTGAGPTGAGPTGGVATPEYRWYTAAQVVSIAGTMMGYTALFWLALHVGHGALGLSTVVAAQFLPQLLFSRRAGAIVTRHRPTSTVIVTQSLQVAGSLAIGLPLLAGGISLWYLVPVAFGIGAIQSVDVPARQALMLGLTGPVELRRGSSLYATVTGLAKIAGPGAVGLLIGIAGTASAGEALVFLTDAASFLGVIAILAWLSRHGQRGQAPAGTGAPARRFRWVLDLPRGVQAAVVMAVLLGGFGLQFAVTNPLMAARVFHLGLVGFGLLGTFTATGGIAGNYYSSRRGDPGRSEFLWWALLFGLAECGAAVVPAVWSYDLLMAVTGGATQLFAVSATVYVQLTTPEAQRGHALSAYNAGFMGFVPVGSFAVAAVATTASVRWALAGPGLVIAVCAAAILAVLRHELRDTAGRPVSELRKAGAQ